MLGMSFVACSPPMNIKVPNPSLEVLGTNSRGYRIARVITHDHSPYSYDACDYNGMPNGQVNSSCLSDLKASFCKNHVDFVFITDHPNAMANYEMSALLLPQSGDTILSTSGAPYANVMSSCDDGFRPTLTVGFESNLVALGMTQHLDVDPSTRASLYEGQTSAFKDQLKTMANAIVVVPHTESRSVSLIESIQPDAIEIYNIHANLDPKIRKTYLGLAPFQVMASLVTYLIDPFKELNPDYAFMGFFQISDIYFQRWNQLIYDNYKVTGLVGTDSHQNIFPQIVADGERFDSHRRLVRFVSNYVLTQTLDLSSVKTAILNGRSIVVAEGIGVPSGIDFYATVGSTTLEVGQQATLSGGSSVITAKMPSIYGGISKGSENPVIRLELRRVIADGKDETVASSTSGDISYTTSQTGAYRVHCYIIPKHLKLSMGTLSGDADREYPWFVTNHIFLN